MALDEDGKFVNSREQFEKCKDKELRDMLKGDRHSEENKEYARRILLSRWDIQTVGYYAKRWTKEHTPNLLCSVKKHKWETIDVLLTTEDWCKTINGIKTADSGYERECCNKIQKCSRCGELRGVKVFIDSGYTEEADVDYLVAKYGLCTSKELRRLKDHIEAEKEDKAQE